MSIFNEGLGVTLRCECGSGHVSGNNATIISNGVIQAGDFECLDCGAKWSINRPAVGDLLIFDGAARTITSVTGDREYWLHAAMTPQDELGLDKDAVALAPELAGFGLDAVDLDMLRRGDKIDSAGAKVFAALTSLIAERDGLREALNNLETANRALCEKRSQATYDSMIDNDRVADELIALDHARLAARTALSLDSNKGDARP